VGFTVCDVDDGTPAFSVRFGQQRAARADDRGHERLEQLLERDCWVGLRGYERAVDRGKGDSREPDGHGAVGVVAERERDLFAEAVHPEPAYTRHDSLDFTAGARGRLYGEDDEQAKEVGMALERSGRGREDCGQVLRGTSEPPVRDGQIVEEAFCSAFHHREQNSVLGAVVVVDGAQRDAGFFDDAGEGRGFEAVLGHDALGGVQHEFAGLHPAAVGGDVGADSHEDEVPVLIVGGGGAGLTASMLLARRGVEHLLVSARPTTSDLPKAHVLNQRAMEVLDDVGAAEAIAQRSTPTEQMAATAYYAGFAGPDADYGHRLARLESWGAGGADELWRAASPWRQLNLPQIRLEPLLKARAEELSPGRIRFNHELIDLDQDDDGVRALIRDNASGSEYVVRCQYLLGADGGRLVHRLIGVEYEGLGVVTQTATLHVSADFSPWAKDPDVLIRWIYSPQSGVLVVMVPMGPERWGPDSEEWVIHLNYPVDCAETDAQVEADARKALGIGELQMEIHKITRWSVEAVIASAFRAGRVFLVGDAAHRHPPTGGLGLTSAIHDAQNLCWKLAAVLAGHASPALLDTYEAERRPVDQRNCQRSLENAVNHFQTVAATGVSPESSPEENMEQLRRVWSGRPENAKHRSTVLRGMRAQSMEFSELNVEYGYSYESAAVVSDGTPAADLVDDIRVYQPSTRPGSPLPHAWIDDEDGNRRPIKDLVPPGRFLLIAGEDGEAWCEAAQALATEADLPLEAVRIGHLDGDVYDPRCAWLRQREIQSDGAILVRPDRFVAWRGPTAADDPVGELAGAFSQILARPVAARPVPAGSGVSS
jgi:2,4-dichlorophenol 6-monooxygenase